MLEQYFQKMLPKIENELRNVLQLNQKSGLEELYSMLAYHLGWEGIAIGAPATGKRIRPVMVLLSCAATGEDWQKALPAAAAIELVHNFSLIHDDIEDNSPLRRGRPTVWQRWGIPQAINAGDAMFTLAHLALLRLEETTNAKIAHTANRIVQETCLWLTQGQYLDMSYEGRSDLGIKDYWPMISGKTAALLGACTQLGAVVGGATLDTCQAYQKFGFCLGLAFQVQDDILGIWGDSARTGKSSESDLVAGKKSLPVLYGLERAGAFAQRWKSGPILSNEAPEFARLLESEGGRAYCEDEAKRLTHSALEILEHAHPQGEAGKVLRELAEKLLNRSL